MSNRAKELPWLRLYTEIIDDEKIGLLSFEDRWHYVALLCMKRKGILDRQSDLRERQIALKLGLSVAELDSVKKRLAGADLIDDDMQPLSWDKRQFESDQDKTAAERQRRRRESQRNG